MKSNINVEGQVDTGVQTFITNQNTEPPKALACSGPHCGGGGGAKLTQLCPRLLHPPAHDPS